MLSQTPPHNPAQSFHPPLHTHDLSIFKRDLESILHYLECGARTPLVTQALFIIVPRVFLLWTMHTRHFPARLLWTKQWLSGSRYPKAQEASHALQPRLDICVSAGSLHLWTLQLFESLMPKSCGGPALITHSKDNTAIKQEATRLGIELLMHSYRAQGKYTAN